MSKFTPEKLIEGRRQLIAFYEALLANTPKPGYGDIIEGVICSLKSPETKNLFFSRNFLKLVTPEKPELPQVRNTEVLFDNIPTDGVAFMEFSDDPAANSVLAHWITFEGSREFIFHVLPGIEWEGFILGYATLSLEKGGYSLKHRVPRELEDEFIEDFFEDYIFTFFNALILRNEAGVADVGERSVKDVIAVSKRDKKTRRVKTVKKIKTTKIIVVNAHKPREVEATHSESGRKYTHRFLVRGHWRNQPYGPRLNPEYHPKWIPAFIKGPKNAPIKDKDEVFYWA